MDLNGLFTNANIVRMATLLSHTTPRMRVFSLRQVAVDTPISSSL